MRFAALSLLLLAAPAGAEALGLADLRDRLTATAPEALVILEAAAARCEDADDGPGGGALLIGERGLVPTDLDGDGGITTTGEPDDMVVDFNHIACARAASLWSGTGGAPVHFVLDGTVSRAWTGWGWEVERIGADLPAVILLPRHGTACGGAGADPCVLAIVASNGRFLAADR